MLQTFDYQNATISYRDIGTGQPVVLLHGFAEDSHIFDRQVDVLTDYCRLIIPDLPGSGLSDVMLDDVADIPLVFSSIDTMAECITALIQSVCTQPVIVLGHSMGGYITLAIAEKYPDLLKAFGLLHSSAFADSEEKKATRKKAIGFIEQNGAAAFLQTTIPDLFAEGYQKEHPEAVQALLLSGSSFTKEALIGYYGAMINRPDRTCVLVSSKIPVLFLLGTVDKAIVMDDVLKQVHLPNVSYFYALENVAHMGMWEDTGKFNSIIIKFITDID